MVVSERFSQNFQLQGKFLTNALNGNFMTIRSKIPYRLSSDTSETQFLIESSPPQDSMPMPFLISQNNRQSMGSQSIFQYTTQNGMYIDDSQINLTGSHRPYRW